MGEREGLGMRLAWGMRLVFTGQVNKTFPASLSVKIWLPVINKEKM